MYMKKTKKISKTKLNNNKTLRISPKDQMNLRKSSAKAINNSIVKNASENLSNNFSISSLDQYINLLSNVIKTDLIKTHSYSPSINKKIININNNKFTNVFKCENDNNLIKTFFDNKFKLNISTNPNKLICVDFNSEKARIAILKNFLLNKKLNPSTIISPIQKHANCWFNTMFMSFFVSDKGKKFMKSFQQSMIIGKTINNKLITPAKLSDSLLLFALSIEACYNNSNIKNQSLAYNTNNIIYGIYNALPNKEGIKNIDEHGNPYLFYKDLIDYLEGNKKSIKMIRWDSKVNVDNFFNNKINSKIIPDVIIITLFDNDDQNKAQSENYNNKPLKVKYNNHFYQLDSAIVRDISKKHFCCGITINKKQYLFDGSVFSVLTKRLWKKWINKNMDWRPIQSTLDWNFMKGYSLLFYYRI